MYIPITLFSGGLPITAVGGDEVGTYVSGSETWVYHKFDTVGSSSFEVINGFTSRAKLVVVGGGGSGGVSQFYTFSTHIWAGGGGAGGVVNYDRFLLRSGSYPLYIGASGSMNGNGEDTWIYIGRTINDATKFSTATFVSESITAIGGGHGAWDASYGPQRADNGGSGGGAYQLGGNATPLEKGVKGTGYKGQGNGGGDTSGISNYGVGGGGGGADSQGGAGYAGLNLPESLVGAGGDGRPLDYSGSLSYFGCGGPGLKEDAVWGTYPTGYDKSYGRGGSAGYDPNDVIPDIKIIPKKPTSGVIIISYPLVDVPYSSEITLGDGNTSIDACTLATPYTFYYESGSEPLQIGSKLYRDRTLRIPVSSSFVSTGSLWYNISGDDGVITSSGSCQRSILAHSGSTDLNACLATTTRTYYIAGDIEDGNTLYSNITLTTLAPNNWYREDNSQNVFQVTNGVISNLQPCNITGTVWRRDRGGNTAGCSYSYIDPYGITRSGTQVGGLLTICVKNGTTPSGCACCGTTQFTNTGNTCTVPAP